MGYPMINQKTALEIEIQRLAALPKPGSALGRHNGAILGPSLAQFGPWNTLSTAQNLDMSHSLQHLSEPSPPVEQGKGREHQSPRLSTFSSASSSFKSSLQVALRNSGNRHFVSPSFQNSWMGKNIDLKYSKPFPC